VSDTTVAPGTIFHAPLTQEQIDQLPMYEWEVAEIGHRAPPFVYEVTAESIADYCQAVRSDNPLYLDADAAAQGPYGSIIAPPTYVFKCSPMRRNEVMHAQGYASPEEKRDRATPYAKCAVHFQRPILVGDTITSVVTLADKYERRGNQFVTWHIEAENQRGEPVVEYDYTIIWRRAPRDPNAKPTPRAESNGAHEEPTGEPLPVTLTKQETQEAIDNYSELTRVRPRISPSLHSDPEFAQRTIYGGTVNMGVATAAYCSELIERAFGPGALLKHGARLEYKGIRPIHAGTEITLTGRVVSKEADRAECEITVRNGEQIVVGVATATVVTGDNA
jgi:acyl dehydratase